MNLIEKKSYCLLFVLIMIIGIISCQTPINEQEEPPKIQKGVRQLIEEYNKEFLIRGYDIQLKMDEIEFCLNELEKTAQRYPDKEWGTELENDIYYERKNKFDLKIKEASMKLDKFEPKIDSLFDLKMMDNRAKIRFKKEIEQLKTLIKDNQQYLDSVN